MKIINDESTVKTVNVDGHTWTLRPFTGVALTLTTSVVFSFEKGVWGGDIGGGQPDNQICPFMWTHEGRSDAGMCSV